MALQSFIRIHNKANSGVLTTNNYLLYDQLYRVDSTQGSRRGAKRMEILLMYFLTVYISLVEAALYS